MTTPSERPTRAEIEADAADMQLCLKMAASSPRAYNGKEIFGFRRRLELDKLVLEMYAALDEIEWVWHWTEEGEGYNECPWCRALLEEGHKSNCTRQAALLP